VQVDANATVSLRQVVVEDAFQMAGIKVTRRRQWPQFPATLPPDLRGILAPVAAQAYAAEDLAWIDVDRHPTEPDAAQSRSFDDPRARQTRAAFHDAYASAMTHRRQARSVLPSNMRERLESLGYVQTASSPAFPEPDTVLPPPPR
jgi:hypothetical protein